MFGSRVGLLGMADPMWWNSRFPKIQDGGCTPFWKFTLSAITRSLLHVFTQNLAQREKPMYRKQKHLQISLLMRRRAHQMISQSGPGRVSAIALALAFKEMLAEKSLLRFHIHKCCTRSIQSEHSNIPGEYAINSMLCHHVLRHSYR